MSEHEPGTKVEDESVQLVTREKAKDARRLFAKYLERHVPERGEAVQKLPEPPRLVGSHARLLPLLKVVPVVLLAVFLFSFYWDFPTQVLSLGSMKISLAGLLRIVSVSGLIGFLTNWLAITMLFNPRQARPIFGQGLIPAQRERVIYRLAKAVSEELINETIIKEKIKSSGVIPKYREMALGITRDIIEDEEFRAELKTLVADYADKIVSSDTIKNKIVEYTAQKLEEQTGFSGLALKMYRFVNEDDFRRRLETAVTEIPGSIENALDGLDHLLDDIPQKIEARSEDIERWATSAVLGFVENIDIYEMVVDNMKGYDETKLEDLLKNTSNEQLNYIKYLGAILGCIGGLVIWRPLVALALLGSLGLILFVVDETIFRYRAKSRELQG